jgi:hypothetical protein
MKLDLKQIAKDKEQWQLTLPSKMPFILDWSDTKYYKQTPMTVKFSHEEETHTISVHFFDSKELQCCAPHVQAFVDAMVHEALHLDPVTLIQIFGCTLSMQAFDNWNDIMKEMSPCSQASPTLDTWKEAMHMWMGKWFLAESRFRLLEYIRSFDKPKSMKVEQYWYKTKLLNAWVKLLLGQ